MVLRVRLRLVLLVVMRGTLVVLLDRRVDVSLILRERDTSMDPSFALVLCVAFSANDD